jgi:signal transduction histidine kinase/CheY-like chemotaxis protein
MGALMRRIDWPATSLGPVDRWPQSLRSVVGMLLQSKAQIILFWGPDFTVLYNDAYRQVFGVKHPSALARPGREAWSEIWEAVLHPPLAGVVRTGEAFSGTDLLFFIERHGFLEETYFDVSYDPVRIESGEVGGVYCIVSETTARVVAARRMALLKDLAAPAAFATTIREACVMAMTTMSRHPADILFALIYLDDALECCTDGAHEKLAAAPAGQVRELVFASSINGLSGRLVVGLNPHRPYDGACQAFLDLVAHQLGTSVAGARAFEQEKQRAEALAELDRAKTTFFSNVSHEFRTPLTLILGPIEDMLAESVNRPEYERLAVIHRNSLRLLKLVNNLLDFSRLDAGGVRPSFEPTDLAALTTDLASTFRAAIERAGMEFHVYCPALEEPVYVDHEMWERVVLNLLSNAFKYTLRGRISVMLERTGGKVVLSVTDTGVGIPEAELPHVFKRFHRIADVHGRTHEGTGIGLALVKELVRVLGGEVTVDSVVGLGTTFSVAVPLGRRHVPVDYLGEARPRLSWSVTASPYVEEALRWLPDGEDHGQVHRDLVREATPAPVADRQPAAGETPRPRILIADDNADMRDYLARLLGAQFDVAVARDGAAALAAARQYRPDLIVADVMMPVLDGVGLLRELRADAALRAVPVLLLSARAGEEARVEGWRAGADYYLVKPFSARELVAQVGTHLELARVRSDAAQAVRQSEERFRAFTSATHDVVYCMNADWSEMRFLQGREFLPDTDSPSRDWLERYIPEDDRPHVMAAIARAIETRTIFELEHRVIRADGAPGWISSRAMPITADDGTIVEWFGAATDVTQRKQDEQRPRADLEAPTLAHELRNPLASIRTDSN